MDKIAKYATIIYAFLFFVGYLSNYVYYSLFNIDINSYFDTYEILFSFLNSVTGNIVIFTIVCLIAIIFIPYTYLIRAQINYIEKKAYSRKYYYKCFFITTLTALILFLSIYLIPINIENINLFGIYNSTLTYKYIVIAMLISSYASLAFAGGSIYLLNRKQNIITNYKVNNDIINLRISESAKSLKRTVKASIVLFVTVVLYLSVSLLQFNKANKTLGNNDKQIMFTYKNELIKTNDSIKYIGDTKNYIFIYDLIRKEINIIERNNTSNYKIKKK